MHANSSICGPFHLFFFSMRQSDNAMIITIVWRRIFLRMTDELVGECPHRIHGPLLEPHK